MSLSNKNQNQNQNQILHECCPPCPKKVRTRVGLTQHQNVCLAFKQYLADLIEANRAATQRKNLAAVEDTRRIEQLRALAEREEAEVLAAEPVCDIPFSHNSGRPRRSTACRLPKRYKDFIPQGPGRLVKAPAAQPPQPSPLSTPQVQSTAPDDNQSSIHSPEKRPRLAEGVTSCYQTEPNSFGLYRRYAATTPPLMPDSDAPLSIMDDTPLESNTPPMSTDEELRSIIHPFPNESAFLFAHHITCSGDFKSKQDDKALFSFVTGKAFVKEDLEDAGMNAVDQALKSLENPFQASDEWKSSSIDIDVPLGRNKDDPDAPLHATYTIPQPFYHRPLTEVIKGVFSKPPDAGQGTETFHYEPFEQWWIPPTSSENSDHQRVYDELYTSQAWIDEHEKLQKSPKEPDCTLPRVIAGCMVWSDSTQTSIFGQNSSMWPIYLFAGNQSKYERAKPTSKAGVHVGYIPKLSSAGLNQFIREKNPNAKNTQPIITHCRRELMQGVWGKMLDSEFIHAYQHGIVIVCGDGVTRRVYPRLFTYSADYPEKVLLATIRDFGGCPCVRCSIPIEKIRGIGSKQDGRLRKQLARIDDLERKSKVNTARRLIYESGYPVNSNAVDRLLKEKSWVPTKNVFSERLGGFGFNFYGMLVVDLLHEFELGVWKSVFIHLLRLVQATEKGLLDTVNTRYYTVPPFGDSVIRKFPNNTTEMKRLAARDFEDLLLCAIPVFEGLLPKEHDLGISRLLFVLCYWHGLAKLRRHTDQTLQRLSTAASNLGIALRNFVEKTCGAFKTFEIPKEMEARLRKEAQSLIRRGIQSSNNPPPPTGIQPKATSRPVTEPVGMSLPTRTPASGSPDSVVNQKTTGKQPKTLSLKTVKLHSLGYYPDQIRTYGTTDSYSTQRGELEHSALKRVVRNRTNKRDPGSQAGQFLRRREIMNQKYQQYIKLKEKISVGSPSTLPPAQNRPDGAESAAQAERECKSDPLARYNIAQWSHDPVNIHKLLTAHESDPAYKDFRVTLQDHILARMDDEGGQEDLPTFSTDERDNLQFRRNRLFSHPAIRINYTSYDLRRQQDFISLLNKDRCNIMVASGEDPCSPTYHPYWYGHVEKIFHVVAHQTGRFGLPSSSPKRFDVLWIRWYGYEKEWEAGFTEQKLDRVGWILGSDDEAYGFLDPNDAIRACHLIPAFQLGRKLDVQGASSVQDPLGDWMGMYVNRFVDRDMMMRYLDGGIGHVEAKAIPKEGGQAVNDVDIEEPVAKDEDGTVPDVAPGAELAVDKDGYEEISEDESESGFHSDAASDSDCDSGHRIAL